MTRYHYAVRRLENVYHAQLENVLNSLIRKGGRIVAFEWGPRTLYVIVEHELLEDAP